MQREILDRFRQMIDEGLLRRATIIEHRPDNVNVVGQFEYCGVNGDASIGIGWRHLDGGNRTTVFYPQLWELEIVENVIFLKRVKEGDPMPFDMPWEGSVLYTIFVSPRN